MATLLVHWLVATAAVFIAALLAPGATSTLVGSLLAALLIGLLAVFVKPIFIALTLPINLLTFGSFSIVVNAALVYLVALVVPGFAVVDTLWALFYGLMLSIVDLFFSVGFAEEESVQPVASGDGGEYG